MCVLVQEFRPMPADLLAACVTLAHRLLSVPGADIPTLATPACALAADVVRKFAGLPPVEPAKCSGAWLCASSSPRPCRL